MGSTWDHMGEIANIAQLTGLDAVRLIGMIVKAANTARMHKTNCRQFAQHLKLIGNLLEQLRISELKKYRETREPLEQLEDALRRSYILVNSCQDRSYFYLLAMGWNIVYQFRKAQDEIDRYLKIIPLITLVDNSRVRERLDDIERDQREYTLDDEDAKVQSVIIKPDPSETDAMLLKKSLSTSYPNMPFNEALKTENEKLKLELQRSQANCDVGQCEVIHHLLDVTEAVNAVKKKKKDSPKKVDDHIAEREDSYDETETETETYTTKEKTIIHTRSLDRDEEWSSDLLGCCSEPLLCLETLICPCGTFAKIASAAKNRHVTTSEACNELLAYSLILSCCCYTCCMRRKLRKTFNIAGGLVDDFLTHVMCCCCALVQEYREIEIQNVSGRENTKTRPPHSQYMES